MRRLLQRDGTLTAEERVVLAIETSNVVNDGRYDFL